MAAARRRRPSPPSVTRALPLALVAPLAFDAPVNGSSTRLLVVCGAQRSGTTMLLEALEKVASLQVHHESSDKVMRDFRLVSLAEVQAVLGAARGSGVVIKPLTDSQWLDRLLANIDGSRAVWMFRNWTDVVNSSARKWPGHGADILAAFRRGDHRWLGWRSERLAAPTRARFDELCADVNVEDDLGSWAAWWWLRNRHFFDLGLDVSPDFVRPVCYEELVVAPSRWLDEICAFAGFPVPEVSGDEVHARSVRRSAPPAVPASVAEACEQLCSSLCLNVERAWRDGSS